MLKINISTKRGNLPSLTYSLMDPKLRGDHFVI
jgi:hypothetical protein